MAEKFRKLAEQLSKLPGIGQRQAIRLVLAIIDWPKSEIDELARTLTGLKTDNIFCQVCFNLSDETVCQICSNPKRDKNKIAVVERVTDLQTIEKAGIYDGVYHVLGGSINPTGNILPEKLKIQELKNRLAELTKNEQAVELILATGTNAYGETTALYLQEELKNMAIKITRLAKGLAAGSAVEYADEATLANALKGRK